MTNRSIPVLDEPTDDEIGNSDVVASVFIQRRIDILRGFNGACTCKPECKHCFGRRMAIQELEGVL